MVLKRVMRRALGGDTRGSRASPSRPTSPQPTPTSTPTAEAPPATPALGSIAARLAGGLSDSAPSKVLATSGAATEDYSDVQIHSTETGESYWGTLDNESSRAKADGKELVIDQWECIACGTCVENTDAVFILPDDAKAVAFRQEGDMELIQDAIDACPVTCIHWTDDPGQFESLNDTDGNPVN